MAHDGPKGVVDLLLTVRRVSLKTVYFVGFDSCNWIKKFIAICHIIFYYLGARGGVVVKALLYKPAGHGFDSRWCHWNFSVT